MEIEILNLVDELKSKLESYSSSKNIESNNEGEFYSWISALSSLEKYFKNKVKNKNKELDENTFQYKGRFYKAVEYKETDRGLGSPCLYCCFYQANSRASNRCIKRLGANIPPCSSTFRMDKKTVFFLPTL